MPINHDRSVHCTIVPGTGDERIEIVRYNRAGKWFFENGTTRKRLTFKEAVKYAASTDPSVTWHEGLHGGTRFDAAVRDARAAAARV